MCCANRCWNISICDLKDYSAITMLKPPFTVSRPPHLAMAHLLVKIMSKPIYSSTVYYARISRFCRNEELRCLTKPVAKMTISEPT